MSALAGLQKRHRMALAQSIRAFLAAHAARRYGFPVDAVRWERWARDVASGTAPEHEYSACQYLTRLPNTEPDYCADSRACEVFVFAMWVCMGTRFGPVADPGRPIGNGDAGMTATRAVNLINEKLLGY